jgi:hypothetical protein
MKVLFQMFKRSKRHCQMGVFVLIINVLFGKVIAQQQFSGLFNDFITDSPVSDSAFPIVSKDKKASFICYDKDDFTGVIRAIVDLQNDIEAVTGVKPMVGNNHSNDDCEIVIGTLGHSKLIDQLASTKKINIADLKGKWESFVITIISDPHNSTKKSLVIAGSDKRGTIYGIYEISRQLGVSPWHWWADVPPIKRSSAYVKEGRYASGEPKVKYRGIFINDENPCMQRWARAKFGGMNSKMYSHMFELILRLRGNCLWPGMWGSFLEHKPLIPLLKDENGNYAGNSFNEDDPENPRLADEYGIVMGTSHHEPMQRSQQEWIRNKANYGNGHWNYMTNKEGIQKFFREGIENTKNYESLITMGMRGEEDAPMVDAGSAMANFGIMQGIMNDQRKIIADVSRKSSAKLQQVWTLYSEVLDYYDQGMKVPDDMIILLCDNNWGDIRRVPQLTEKKHPGGYGMYYHVGYYGAVRAYKWLNVTQIQQMWEQLQLTYEYGVDKFWMLNVGDLKPNEFPIDFFMEMAWDPKRFNQDNLDLYTQRYCGQMFGFSNAEEAGRILDLYCKYSSRITPEMLNENTYNLRSGEFKMVKDEFLALEARALRLFLAIEPSYRDTYKQLLLYPVQAMANLYDMYYALAMNKKLAAENDIAANTWADHVAYCFKRDAYLSADYNNNIANGKWNHMMDQVHIGYKSWHCPEFNIMPEVKRVEPTNVKQGGYVFYEKNGVVVMEAEHYYKCDTNTHTHWTIIPNMGRTLSGIALMPYTQNTEMAALHYQMHLKTQADSIKVYVFLDSTMPFQKGGHHVALGFDGGQEKTWNINKDLTWKNNYSKMYPTGAARIIETVTMLDLPKSKNDILKLTFRPLDPGVVIHKIVVDAGGYEQTFLKMPESPYVREK